MAEFTENLNLEMPDKTEQYNIAVQNSNMKKIDDFSKLVPPKALTADKLTSAKNINGVAFDGSKNIISGLGMYSPEENYNSTDIVYTFDNDKLKLYRSLAENNSNNQLSDTNFWLEQDIGGIKEEDLIPINGYLVESYQNGTMGLAHWSNGLLLQWGKTGSTGANTNTTVTLLKSYASGDSYIAVATHNGLGSAFGDSTGINSQSAERFVIHTQTNGATWHTIGFAEVSNV